MKQYDPSQSPVDAPVQSNAAPHQELPPRYEKPEIHTAGTAVELLKGVWKHFSDNSNYTYIYKE